MKVHVTLAWRLHRDPSARLLALRRVLRAGRMKLLNRARFERFGVITGEIDPRNLGRVLATEGVAGAELDEDTPLAAVKDRLARG